MAKKKKQYEPLPYKDGNEPICFLIALAVSFAIIPGIPMLVEILFGIDAIEVLFAMILPLIILGMIASALVSSLGGKIK